MADNLHSGHRDRLRKRFLDEGLDNFTDHQVLELLLFYALPRRDTNPIAHHLLKSFNGSLKAVFEAHPQDLQEVGGFGESGALFINLMSHVTRRYYQDSMKQTTNYLDTSEKAAEYIQPFMVGRAEELFFVLCLDKQLKLKAPVLVAQGVVDGLLIHPRQVVEAVVRTRASAVILAHNHPAGTCAPSREDLDTTSAIVSILGGIDVAVLDHIITAGSDYFSFRRAGRLGAGPMKKRRLGEDQTIPFNGEVGLTTMIDISANGA